MILFSCCANVYLLMHQIKAIRENKHTDSPAIDHAVSAHLLEKSASVDEDSVNMQTKAVENEVGINIAFQMFCKPKSPEEMDIRDFVKLWRDLKVLTRRFNSVEVESIFRKTIAKLQSLEDTDPLKECLFFDKRINYVAFRSISFGMIAKGRSMTVDDLASFILPNVMELHEAHVRTDA